MKQEKNIWEQSRVELFQKLDCRETGLSQEDAALRLLKYGANELHAGKQKSVWQIFLGQFADFLVLILILAAVISACTGDVESMIVILAVITMNAILGTVQTVKASASLDSLKQMSAPTAKVLRDGQIVQIPGREVVPGDVVILEAGDSVCADGRLLECASLKCAESALTGESLPVEKDTEPLSGETALGDRKNMVFSGSFVTYGRGRFLVTATGMDTEMGKIAQLLKNTEERKTPLQVSLDQFGRKLSIIILVICAVLFGVSVLWRHENVMNAFLFAVALAVAAIPEALSSIVTIVLSFGTRKMAKENAIIRHLQAVEGLGSVSVICSDKTGTLTQNRMKVTRLAAIGKGLEQDEEKRRFILTLFTLCNDVKRQGTKIIGEPTEKALAEAAEEGGVSLKGLWEEMPRIGEVPFSSERKLMTTVHPSGGKWISVTKGAPDILFEKCAYCLDGGRQAVFDGRRKSEARLKNGEMAANALRVVAVAFREWDEEPLFFTAEELERELVFAGMAGMMDPPRPEAQTAVEICQKAGIRPVMITGDHALTAQAIAAELGIYRAGDTVLTGQVLEQMSDEALERAAEDCTVFARVSPAHKVRIVKAFQKEGRVVAMTGDGVNDAPALKAADIGCAMGKNGTEVAKGAAEMILMGDNFATIVEAVREGRGIYENIRKAVHFLLSSNIGEIMTIFVAMCFGWATPLLPIQLLWVNLVTDSLPAIALGVDPADADSMEQPPRKGNSLFSDGMVSRIALEGAMIGMLALLAFGIGHIYFDEERAYITGRTMAFAVLSLSQLIHAFNMRSEHSLFRISPLGNPMLLLALFIGCLMQIGVIMVLPLAEIFKVCPLNGTEWLIVGALALTPLPVVELEKLCDRRRRKK